MTRTAYISGGLAGMGLEVARAMRAAGHRVAVGGRRGGNVEAQQAAHEALGEDAFAHELDVCDETSVARFCQNAATAIGDADILVNCAGIEVYQTVSEHDIKAWQRVIDTNLTGSFLMMREVLPGMKARGWGRIVTIASTAAHTAMPDQAAYCASKAGLLGLSRAVALEGAPHGVTSMTVSPTWVETDMLRESASMMARENGTSLAQEIEALARSNPQNRLVQPQEVAALIAFLCSSDAPALTMEDIQINAGALW
ncbi:SDR family NAD(P)-dependent oxidoreductase [Roseovarius aestuariivivens]|uniref:SDR family NAD(P)-dependent oxidoreductase n=1 Tax=Roseovarius aestuariivivens TaxID=1888910 RepID=UPI00108142BB|nr:SDR family oxidoreductase [Roseovarius aestuariivivens]